MSTILARLPLAGAFAVWLGSACLAGAVVASEDSAEAAAVVAEQTFSLLKTDGEIVVGELKEIGPRGEILLLTSDDKEKTIPSSLVVKLVREGTLPTLAPEPSAAVLFPEGDRIRSAIGAASDTHLEVQSYSLGKLAIPLDSILGLILSHQSDSDQADLVIGRVRNEPRTSEVAWLANGDRLDGGFLGLTEKSVDFLVAKKPIKLDRAGVVALGLDPAQVVYPLPETDFYEFTFYDGSRLGLTNPKIEQDHLSGTTRFGLALRVGLNELARVQRRSRQLVYLDERPVAAEKYVGYIGNPRPFRKNATVEGHTFRLSGHDFDRGLGTESRTLLAYRVEPGDLRFQASVGLDDRSGPLGNVVFAVIVDGVERFKSPPMSVRDGPKTLDIDLQGAKVLVLITEFGERGNVRDIADWVEARILR